MMNRLNGVEATLNECGRKKHQSWFSARPFFGHLQLMITPTLSGKHEIQRLFDGRFIQINFDTYDLLSTITII